MATRLRMSLSDWLLLVMISVFWGGGFFFVGLSVHEIPPLTLAFLRCAIATLMLLAYLHLRGFGLPADPATWLALLPLAAMNTTLPFILIFWGQLHIPSSLAGILNATGPLWAILLAHYATTDDRLTLGRAVGVAVGFAGVVIVIGIDALRDLGVHVVAQLSIVGAAFFYSASAVYGRRFKALPAATVAAAVLLLGAATSLPFAVVVERPWALPMPSLTAVAAMLGLAVVSTGLAFIFYFRVLARAGAVNFQLVAFLTPVSAILLGVGFLGETLAPRHFIGMAMIGVGLAVIDDRPREFLLRGLRRKPSAT